MVQSISYLRFIVLNCLMFEGTFNLQKCVLSFRDSRPVFLQMRSLEILEPIQFVYSPPLWVT